MRRERTVRGGAAIEAMRLAQETESSTNGAFDAEGLDFAT